MTENSAMAVLVVDDSPTVIRITRKILLMLGIEDVDEANGGATALQRMRLKRYDLIISDWNMEPMTGLDLVKQVRADSEFGQTPFIMVTAETHADKVVAAKQAGVNNYIIKPFDALTMKAKINAVFARPNL